MSAYVSRPCLVCQAAVLSIPAAATGRRMVLDAKPEKRVILTKWNVGGAPERGEPLWQDRAEVIDAYTAHTCAVAS